MSSLGRRLSVVVLCITASAALIACSAPTATGPGATTNTTATATGSVGDAPTSVAAGNDSGSGKGQSSDADNGGQANGTANCTIEHLSVTDKHGMAASGHRSMVLVFTNTGDKVCRLFGYPGVAGLNTVGDQIAQAQRATMGYLGGLPGGQSAQSQFLSKGESASAIVEALAFNGDGSSCTPYAGLLVTSPNETHSVKLPWDNDGCSSLQVHPVVLGTDGTV